MPLSGARTILLDELRRHVPSDAAEREHVEETVRLVESESACFARGTFSPGHITASAFIVDAEGRLLLHHHRRLDRWLQMGGHDEGEHDPVLAACREAREESGLEDLELVLPNRAILDVDVHVIPAGRNEPAHRHHDVRYLLATRSPDRIARDDSESRALSFFSLAEAVERLGEPSAARVIEKIRRALASS